MLGRSADAAGLSYWSSKLKAQQIDVRQLVEHLAASAEFRARWVTGKSATQVITALYDTLLARAPDAAGLSYWVGQLQGMDYTKLVQSMLASAEYTQSFGTQTVPGNGRPGCT